MTHYKDGLAELKAAIAEGRGGEKVTYRQQFNTYLLSHNLAPNLKHQAQVYGLDTSLDSGSGMFSRSHMIKTVGTVKDTWVFWSAAMEWMEKNS